MLPILSKINQQKCSKLNCISVTLILHSKIFALLPERTLHIQENAVPCDLIAAVSKIAIWIFFHIYCAALS